MDADRGRAASECALPSTHAIAGQADNQTTHAQCWAADNQLRDPRSSRGRAVRSTRSSSTMSPGFHVASPSTLMTWCGAPEAGPFVNDAAVWTAGKVILQLLVVQHLYG